MDSDDELDDVLDTPLPVEEETPSTMLHKDVPKASQTFKAVLPPEFQDRFQTSHISHTLSNNSLIIRSPDDAIDHILHHIILTRHFSNLAAPATTDVSPFHTLLLPPTDTVFFFMAWAMSQEKPAIPESSDPDAPPETSQISRLLESWNITNNPAVYLPQVRPMWFVEWWGKVHVQLENAGLRDSPFTSSSASKIIDGDCAHLSLSLFPFSFPPLHPSLHLSSLCLQNVRSSRHHDPPV